MKIEIEHEGSCLSATGGTGRLIVRDPWRKAIPSLSWFARRPAPWISPEADMIDGVARSPHPPLRHRRDRQRELALQEPRLAFPRSVRLRNPDQLRRGERYRFCQP
jgi:hypothetical protein